MNTTDAGIKAAKTTVFHSMQHNFDRACEFMSAYILSKHVEAQHAYANRLATGGQRCNISGTGSDVERVGRGQGGPSGQQSGRSTGRGHDRLGRTNRRTRAYINNVDVNDPHRNFTAAEWESSVQCAVSYCKCAKVAAVVAAEGMTSYRSPSAPHNALPAWSRGMVVRLTRTPRPATTLSFPR